MSSLDNLIDLAEGISTEGDIDKAIEYSELLNEPLLTLGQYKQLKRYLDEYNTSNNRRVSSDVRSTSVRAYYGHQDYVSVRERLSNVQEEYEDDFI